MKRMRMSVRRLEALCAVAGRGIDELDDEIEFDPEALAVKQAAEEGLRYLHRWLNEIKVTE